MIISMTVMTKRGYILIPAEIRRKWGIQGGTKVSIEEREGEIVLKLITPAYIRSNAGVLKSGGKLTRVLLEERKNEII
jgi:AbrB family looped-hinge helix DNA binding protein